MFRKEIRKALVDNGFIVKNKSEVCEEYILNKYGTEIECEFYDCGDIILTAYSINLIDNINIFEEFDDETDSICFACIFKEMFSNFMKQVHILSSDTDMLLKVINFLEDENQHVMHLYKPSFITHNFKAYYVDDLGNEVTLFTGTEDECEQYKKDNVYYSKYYTMKDNKDILNPTHVLPSPSRYLIYVKEVN